MMLPQTLSRRQLTPSQITRGGAVAALLILQIGLFWGGIGRSLRGSTDFRAFYTTGKLIALHRGSDIYDLGLQAEAQHRWVSPDDQTLPFLYPAFSALVFVPLGCLPFKMAYVGFLIANLIILVLVNAWIAKEVAQQTSALLWPAYVLTFGSVPALMALLQGQISCLLVAVFVGTLILSRRKHDFLAGLCLSLLFCKFQLALPIAFLLLAWRRWALVMGMLGGALFLTVASVIVVGVTGAIEYVHMIFGVTRATAVDPIGAKMTYGMFPSDMPNIHGAAYVLTCSKMSLPVTVLVSGGLMLWAGYRDRGLPAALCVAMLVSYHFQAYDLTLLSIPLSIALGEIVRRDGSLLRTRIAEVHPALRRRLLGPMIAAGLLIGPVGAAIVYCRTSWILCAAIVAVLTRLGSQSTAECNDLQFSLSNQ